MRPACFPARPAQMRPARCWGRSPDGPQSRRAAEPQGRKPALHPSVFTSSAPISRPAGRGVGARPCAVTSQSGASGPALRRPARVSLRPPQLPPRRCAAPPSGCISPNLCRGEPARPLEGLKGTPQVPAVWPQEDPSMDASRRGKGPPSRAPAGCPAPSDVGSASPPRARALPGPCLVVGVASDPSTSCLGLLQPRKPSLRAPQVRSLAQSLLPRLREALSP